MSAQEVMSLRLPPEMREKLKRVARSRNIGESAYIKDRLSPILNAEFALVEAQERALEPAPVEARTRRRSA